MAYFIELTEHSSDDPLWINLDSVEYFEKLPQGTNVHFPGDKKIPVQESLSEVMTQVPKTLRERLDHG